MKQTRHRASFPGTAMIAALVALTVAAAPGQDRVEVVERPDSKPANSHYAGHREPLLPSPLIHLPFGAIKPQGWLRRQLELQAAGFVGHLTEISGFCNPKGNAWLSPEGIGSNGWEELPYWLRGFAATAFILDDKALIEQAMPWIETAFASQRDDGYFGPRSNLKENGAHDLMSNQSSGPTARFPAARLAATNSHAPAIPTRARRSKPAVPWR